MVQPAYVFEAIQIVDETLAEIEYEERKKSETERNRNAK